MDYIRQVVTETIKEKIWFHGTPDSREIEKEGGFKELTIKVDYINDIEGLKSLQQKMNKAKKDGDETLYLTLLNEASKFYSTFFFKKPLFLTDKRDVASTYTNLQRAFDYQNAEPKIYSVEVQCDKLVQISAFGDRFRFINVNKVKEAFIKAGISEEEIETVIKMFNYYVPENSGIRTDVIAAIGNWLGFDCIDVIGVLDSYQGGSIKSTVRMVLNPTKSKIQIR